MGIFNIFKKKPTSVVQEKPLGYYKGWYEAKNDKRIQQQQITH